MPAPPPDPSSMSDRSPRLAWSEDGAPRSGRFDDVYFSTDDGLAESRAVFLQGCGLPAAWAGRDRFTVVELGFGTGLNIVALLALWIQTRPSGAQLNIVSVEAFPMSRDEARRALAAWPEVAEISTVLLDAWPSMTPGFHRVDLPGLYATLDLLVGDAAEVLGEWSGRADAWFLDGFSPALNPAMWSPEVFDRIAERSAPGARLATFTVAGAVRRGLSERGFEVEKRPGHGRKRERLEARRTDAVPMPRTQPRIAVIGAGIAGASICRALMACGNRPMLIEADVPGSGASGFPAALVTPRLDAGDTVIAGLYAQALERAGDLNEAVSGAIVARGVVQIVQAARDPARFAKIAAQAVWRDGAMTILNPADVEASAGEPAEASGLAMAEALTIRPAAVLEAWLHGVDRIRGTVVGLEPHDGGWQLLVADGEVLAEVDQVVVASGWGTAYLLPELALSPVRGQADWVDGVRAPALAWGGYVAPTGDGLLYGATHDRGDEDTAVRESDSARNREALAQRLPRLAARIADRPVNRRAAVRATTPDRLPLCGAVPGRPGLWVLSGLGSRGFCVAPLLGEHLAATILGLPSPLPASFAGRLAPVRPARGLPDRPSG